MGLFTYDDSSRREDLLSILRDVSPVADNWLVTHLAATTAMNTVHEWPVFNIDRPTSVTFAAEGADFSDETNPQPTRSTNFTAIITRAVRVSGTERAIDTATHEEPFTFQKRQSLRKLKADMEFALLNGAGKVSGSSGTAREMAGINLVISTNLTERDSGTSMSTTELEDVIQNSWDAVGAEFVGDMILCPMGIKRKIATFTTRVTPFQNDKLGIFNNVQLYESSSGPVKIIPHKDVINGTGTTHVYLLREELFKMSFLRGREPKFEELSKIGDADRGHYITEMTLESSAERASVKRFGYALTG